MGIRSFKACTLGGILYAVVWSGMIPQGGWASGYLNCTGPVPLRFAAEKPASLRCDLPPLAMENSPPASNATPEQLEAASEDVVTPKPVAATVTPAGTNAAASVEVSFPASAAENLNAYAIPQPQSRPDTPETAGTALNTPASDLLVVTPQMLVDYFKPNRGKTNGASAVVYAPVDFTPPASAKGSAPASQATYRTQ